MRRSIVFLHTLLVVSILAPVTAAAAAAPAPERVPEDQVLGIRLGMSQAEVAERMRSIADPNETMQGKREGWVLEDERFGHMVVRYDHDFKVKWVTLLARPDGRRVRYRDVGDLERAQRGGDYFFTWSVPAQAGRSGYSVWARGDDPEYLSALSLSPYVPPRPGRLGRHRRRGGEPWPQPRRTLKTIPSLDS